MLIFEHDQTTLTFLPIHPFSISKASNDIAYEHYLLTSEYDHLLPTFSGIKSSCTYTLSTIPPSQELTVKMHDVFVALGVVQ